MKNISRYLGAFTLALGIAASGGCKNKFDKAISEMGDWRDKMCACTDKACADQVNQAWREWRGATKRSLKPDKPTQEQDYEWEQAQSELEKCRAKFRDDKPPAAPSN
jgi:hypothetical protein